MEGMGWYSMTKPTRREALTLGFSTACVVATTTISTLSMLRPRVPPAPGEPLLHFDASAVDDVSDPDYVFWPNLGSDGGGMVIRRDMIRRR
jgi:hypothetical protein